VKIETGVDDDKNGKLDDGEVDDTRYVCNGVDGMTPVVNVKQGCGCRVGRDGDSDPTGLAIPLLASAGIAALIARRRRR
jgi:MYXO-CTERM domain-containing protein